MHHQGLCASPRSLTLPEELLLCRLRQGCQFKLQERQQVAYCWVAFIEAEQPQIADPTADQNPLLFQALELALGDVEPKVVRIGDALRLPLAVARQNSSLQVAVRLPNNASSTGFMAGQPLLSTLLWGQFTSFMVASTPDRGGRNLPGS